MRTTSTLVSAALVAGVSAHTRIYGAWVNGVDQGDGRTTYIRSPPNNDPVKDMTSPNLVCNVAGATPASGFVTAAAGDTIALEWYHDNRGDDIIAQSHVGPVITWIAPYFEDDGAAGIWTKIAEEGYDGTSWATDKLIAAKGMAEFTMPSTLAPGQYMIRQEIVALHEADACFATAGSRGAQFYPSCVQFEVTGSGTATPDGTFDFNAEYSCAVPGIEFNVYGDLSGGYPIPGGDVSTLSGGTSSGGSTGNTGTTPTTTSPATATTPATNNNSNNNNNNNNNVATTLSTSTTSAPTSAATGGSNSGSSSGSGSGSDSGSDSCTKRRKARRDALRAAALRA